MLTLEYLQRDKESLNAWYDMRLKLKEYHRPFSSSHNENMDSFDKFSILVALKNYLRMDWHYFFLKQGDDRVGICEVNCRNSDFDDSRVIYIACLFIEEEYRGKGYTRGAVELLKDMFPNDGGIELHCEYDNPAHGVYKALGMKKVETRYREC